MLLFILALAFMPLVGLGHCSRRWLASHTAYEVRPCSSPKSRMHGCASSKPCQPLTLLLIKKVCEDQGIDDHDMPKVIAVRRKIQTDAEAELETSTPSDRQ